jgi:hypothetical protein
MIRKWMAAVVLTAVLLMTGCASVPMASKGADAKAKQFTSSAEGKAQLYVYRKEIIGAAIKMPVLVDGMEVGDTVAKAYIFKALPAGTHTVVSKAENDSTLEIDMQAGHSYFVWQEVKMGVLYARSKLHLVSEETGEAGVKECSLIKGDGTAEAALTAPTATTAVARVSDPPTAPTAPQTATPAAAPVTDMTTPKPVPVSEPVSEPAAPAPTVAPMSSTAAVSSMPQESAATAAIEPMAQSVATQLGCGAVQSNGAATFVAPCDSYSVLIDCDGGKCRPMHTVNVKHDE